MKRTVIDHEDGDQWLVLDDSYTRTPDFTVCWMMTCRQTDGIEEKECIGFGSPRTATCCAQAASFHAVHCPWGAKTGVHTVLQVSYYLKPVSTSHCSLSSLLQIIPPWPSMEDVCQLHGAASLPPPLSLCPPILILSACAESLDGRECRRGLALWDVAGSHCHIL